MQVLGSIRGKGKNIRKNLMSSILIGISNPWIKIYQMKQIILINSEISLRGMNAVKGVAQSKLSYVS